MPTGQLIKLYRIDRKKSTTNVATLAGITVRYLEMIEAGTKTPTLHVLRQIAKVLGVRTSALLGEAPSEHHEGPVNPRLAEIERALFTYRSVSLLDRENQTDLADVDGRITAAEEVWYLAPESYVVLELLPGLIVDTERVVQEQGGSPESCKVAYRLYRLVRGVMKHVGRIDLCSMLADRCMRYAEESEDPLTTAAGSWTLGQAMLSDDMPHGALDVSLVSAQRLEASLSDGTPEDFSVYGGLIQIAAIAATRTGDPWRSRDMLRDKAKPAAERVGEGHNYHNIFFGPTNVAIHSVSVELENGEPGEALRLSNDVDISKVASRERQFTHLMHVARCYEFKCNDTAVLVHLQMAEKIRPQAFLYRKEPRQMVGSLVRRAKPSYASEVREFASRIGILD
ncbi:MAG: helix-turn-helix domain-containing protein [Pseudonocardiaceae bacterium]